MRNKKQEHEISLLMCAPGEDCEGGISAVVFGLIMGLKELNSVNCTRILYAKPYNNITRVVRVIRELIQYMNYISKLILSKTDIVHVQSSFDKKTIFRDSAYLLAAKIFKIKFVLHAHGGAWHRRTEWSHFWKWISKSFLEKCSLVLVTSSEELTRVKEISRYIKVLKIDNPVKAPVNINSISKKSYAPEYCKIRLIFASRLIEAKGILETIRAFAILGRSDCELHIFGDGPLRETAKNLASSLGAESIIYFHGNISLENLVSEYLNSDIYIFPSYHHEGFPMSLFFAAACSLPIICTKVRPLPDFFSEPENCLWVEPRNSEMIAKMLDILLSDTELMISMSKNNQKVIERFQPHKIAIELERIYFELLFSPRVK